MGTLRTLLAISVVFSHTSGNALVGGRNAVQLFYIISGFLISYVLTEVRSYKTVKAFYFNRYLRLFPIYAVVALLTLAAYTLTGNGEFFATYAKAPTSADLLLAFSNSTLFFQDWVMFLGIRQGHLQFVKDFYVSDPQLYKGLLAWQAWTLGVELTFYAIAPFLLKNRNLIYVALCASLALRALFIILRFGLIDPWTYRFFPAELGLFLFGALSHQLLLTRFRKLTPAQGKVLSWAATIGMIVLCLIYPWINLAESVKTIFLLGAFILLAPAMFEFQVSTKWDNFIGSLSYPIYISHMLVLWIVHHIFWHFHWTGEAEVTTLTVFGSIVAAYILDRFVGVPVEMFRARLRTGTNAAQRDAIAPRIPSA